MGQALHKRLKSDKFDGTFHEAILNIWVTSSFARGLYEDIFDGVDLTFTQYNVLRILNGAFPNGYSRADLSSRMLDRAPDLTRLIDRLVKRGLVQRLKSESDGRQSVARITARGRQLVVQMHPKARDVEKAFSQRLTEAEALELSRLCEKIYGVAIPED